MEKIGIIGLGYVGLPLAVEFGKQLAVVGFDINEARIEELKNLRKNNSIALQNKIFDQYHFLNRAGIQKSLIELFKEAGYKNCVAGAGECAGPKLLQYAFQNKMQPLAIAEFWWGLSPKSEKWKHGHFYPCCKEKCEPILTHMLSGIDKA